MLRVPQAVVSRWAVRGPGRSWAARGRHRFVALRLRGLLELRVLGIRLRRLASGAPKRARNDKFRCHLSLLQGCGASGRRG